MLALAVFVVLRWGRCVLRFVGWLVYDVLDLCLVVSVLFCYLGCFVVSLVRLVFCFAFWVGCG